MVLIQHSKPRKSPVQGEILGPQGRLGPSSEGHLVLAQSGPVLFFLPDGTQDPASTEDRAAG